MVLFKIAKFFIKPSSTISLLPYVLIIPIILFQALSLSGCASTSPAIPSIYIVSLEPAANTSTPNEVRIGYFGICGDDGTSIRCMSSSGGDVKAVTTALFPSGNGTNANSTGEITLDLVATALDLQSQIFISTLAGSAFLFVVGLVFLFLHKRDVAKPNPEKPKRSAIFRRGTYGILCLSTALVFASSLATTSTAGALDFASRATDDSNILMHAGRTLQVLQWMAFGFSTLFVIAVPILVGRRKVEGEKEIV